MALQSNTLMALDAALADPGAYSELSTLLNNASALASTEIAYIDGVTAGTVTASKAVVVDSNKDVSALRHITAASLKGVSATSGNTAGTALATVGGAGYGTGAGGAITLTGGASGSGATGNGGAASIVGGAAASTNGTGGAGNVTGGAATGTGTGGAVAITGGASAGASGTAGSVTIDPGAATGGTAGTITLGGTNACNVVIGASSFFKLPQTAITTEGFIWYDLAAHVLKYRDNVGTMTVTAS